MRNKLKKWEKPTKNHFFEAVKGWNGAEKSRPSKGTCRTFKFQLTITIWGWWCRNNRFSRSKSGKPLIFPFLIDLESCFLDILYNFEFYIDGLKEEQFYVFASLANPYPRGKLRWGQPNSIRRYKIKINMAKNGLNGILGLQNRFYWYSTLIRRRSIDCNSLVFIDNMT